MGDRVAKDALYDALGVYLNGAFNQTGDKILVLYTDGVTEALDTNERQ